LVFGLLPSNFCLLPFYYPFVRQLPDISPPEVPKGCLWQEKEKKENKKKRTSVNNCLYLALWASLPKDRGVLEASPNPSQGGEEEKSFRFIIFRPVVFIFYTGRFSICQIVRGQFSTVRLQGAKREASFEAPLLALFFFLLPVSVAVVV